MEESVGAKTEEPSPRRLAEVRRQGGAPLSRDFVTGLAGVAVCMTMVLGGRAWVGGLLLHLRLSMESAASGSGLVQAGAAALGAAVSALWWPLGAIFVATVAGGFAQTKCAVSFKYLKLGFRLITLSGVGRRSGRARFEIATGLLKSLLVAGLAWWALKPLFDSLGRLVGARVATLADSIGGLSVRLALRLSLAMAAWGVADFILKRYEHHRRLRMTLWDARRELKEAEGDPLYREERRRLRQARLYEQTLEEEVRQASVVVVGAGRTSVALRYDQGEGTGGNGAPVVVAKRSGMMAVRMNALAREAEVPMATDPNLAGLLFRVNEGEEIPESLYHGVAELLSAVARAPKKEP